MEEIANSVTHGIGFLLSIAGLVVLVVLAYVTFLQYYFMSYPYREPRHVE